MSLKKLTAAAAATVLGLTLSACGGDPTEGDDGSSSTGTITVGSAAFPENEIIAEIYAQALEAKGVEVEKRLNIGAREAYIPALENGEIDLIPEYSGNLLTYLDPEATATAADEVESALDEALPEGVVALDTAEAENKDSLNVTSELAESEGLETIGDLEKLGGFTLGANPEFETRAYGIPGLEETYGLTDIEFQPISDSGGPATVKALLDGDVDVADIYSTTPAIVENDLVTLEDPENLIAAQNIVPIIREDKLTDEVEEVLNAISEQLTTEDLLELNGRNQGEDKVAPATLAEEWLTENDLL